MNLTPLERVVAALGNQSILARRLNVTPQAIQHWMRVNRVPAERVVEVERACNGVVTRQELRPDLYVTSEAA